MREIKKRDRYMEHIGNNCRRVVDHDFNYIMETDVKIAIATAFIFLEAGLNQAENYGKLSEMGLLLLEKKASQMKREINGFIDSQKQRIIESSKI